MQRQTLFAAMVIVLLGACDRGSSKNALEPELAEAGSVASASAATAAAPSANLAQPNEPAGEPIPEPAASAKLGAVRPSVSPASTGPIDVTPSAANGYCKRMEAGKCLQHCYPSPGQPGVCLAKPHGQTAPEPPRR